MNLIWIPFIIFDTILKGFLYGWMIIVPLLIIITVLGIKEKKIYIFLIFVLFSILLTSRLWGPKLYINTISNQIENKESLIEEKLEKKYNRNFTLLSKEKAKETGTSDALFQDIRDDYSAIYKFTDDDGVVAIVEYKINLAWDYYQVKRDEYDIEQSIYNYAKNIGLEKKLYIKELNRDEYFYRSKLESIPKSDYIDTMKDSDLLFVMTKEIDNSEEFISNALKSAFGEYEYHWIYEYIVTESEYQKIKNYYESDRIKNYLSDSQEKDRYDIDKNSIINYKNYRIK